MIRIIGFAGPKRAGKDTAGQVLVNAGYTKVAFADPIKSMITSLLTVQGATHTDIARMMEGDLKEVPTDYLSGQSPRYAMQTLGTEWGREVMAPDFWIDAFNNRVASLKDAPVVITDVRFNNESVAIRRLGGLIVHIERDVAARADPHKSEAGISRMSEDMVLKNNYSTIEQFQNLVRYTFIMGEN